ncbi:type II toxin-antitoxin system Phd/YefM family antitoxin [Rhizobium sp. SL86]|uniref:type II toxin-antitoxin system Phd/YefM family antitoxin n=1 Tax=Rhizobium sp. SL86 TaxID=2995148 RepID=UPI002276B1B8|nr:type II toxin-antitoxin system prevent-host-death family antitoxin [Rhizobium sp. SL86]MCY1664912.1 type II toxin-antitoxin system prevent-host-death family antitoxin [Rhizobium sp. SL86]
MKTVSLQEARSDLPRLVDEAANGKAFVIEKDGKPVVKVVPVEEKPVSKSKRRLGFLEGRFPVPDDFDRMFAREIEEMFYGEPK